MLEEEKRTEEQAKKKAKATAKPTKSATMSTTKSTTKSSTKKVQVPKKTVARPPAQPPAQPLLHASIKVYSDDAQCPYFVFQVIDLEVNDTLRRARVLYGPDDDEWICCLNEMKCGKWRRSREVGGLGRVGRRGERRRWRRRWWRRVNRGGERPLTVKKKKRLINFSNIFATVQLYVQFVQVPTSERFENEKCQHHFPATIQLYLEAIWTD